MSKNPAKIAVTESEQVAQRWDENEWVAGTPKDYWACHPIIQEYIHAHISPNADHMLDQLKKTFFFDTTLPLALSIGCGMGAGDRQALAAGLCSRLDGFDLSPKSIEMARQHAEQAGFGDRVRYWVDDANTLTLPENHYDIALAFGAVHHIKELERLCEQLERTLKPDSLIFMHEFVGPARFQWSDEQLEVMNRVMAILPAAWRRREIIERLPEAEVIASDPSEAVRSDEIIELFSRHFEIIDIWDVGGGFLMPLWERGTNPDILLQSSPEDRQIIVKLLILIDELLAEHAIIPSNFAQLVFRNRRPTAGSQPTRRLSAHGPARRRWTDLWLPPAMFEPVVKQPTPWWRLPYKAWQISKAGGVSSLVTEAKNYVRWLRST
jgi:O-antigen biosynthesis protein